MDTSRRLWFGAAALAATTVFMGATPALAAGSGGGRPPGNNGTVKIDEYTMDAGQDNDPHVTCGFSVNFFGYDSGPQQASISLRPVAPTAGGGSFQTTTSWNQGSRTGGNQFDQTVPISMSELSNMLSGVTPQARQGYHLRLEVEVTGSRGADDKYKTFWLQPCASSSPAAATTGRPPMTGPSAAGSTGAASASPGTSAPVPASSAVVTAAATSSAGRIVAAPSSSGYRDTAALSETAPAPSASAGGNALRAPGSAPLANGTVTAASVGAGSLAFTGADIIGTAAAGLGLIGAGSVLAIRSRRRTPDRG
jgi:hypothetical protein